MNSAVKMIIGLLVAAAGVYWYAADFLKFPAFSVFGTYSIEALKTVFFGVFGIFLILFGLLVAWIEYEDMKWEREEKKNAKKQK
jgi:H+/Cl- antiporter ClcA